MKRLAKNDWIVYYSPRTALEDGEKVQAFTAIGRVIDDAPFQAKQTEDFHPLRRSVAYATARESKIQPLLEVLSFTRGRVNWGVHFRRGSFEIPKRDFDLIARAMGVRPDINGS